MNSSVTYTTTPGAAIVKPDKFLFKAGSTNSTSREIYVGAGRAALIKFFGICENGCGGSTACATVTEVLYAQGVMPHKPKCGTGCLAVAEGAKLVPISEQPILDADTCKPLCINKCRNIMLIKTPGIYRIEIPDSWAHSVNAELSDYEVSEINETNRMVVL